MIVLTGAGDRAFTTGLDLKELGSDPKSMGAANATHPPPQKTRSRPCLAVPSRSSGRSTIAITGNFLDAQTAYAWGLVNRVVELAELVPAAVKLAADPAQIETEMVTG